MNRLRTTDLFRRRTNRDLVRLQEYIAKQDRVIERAHEQALAQNDRLRDLERQRDEIQERLRRSEQESEGLRVQLAETYRRRSLPELAEGSAPVFFVVGHEKSGTTWLMHLLDSHPEILCKGEGRFFEHGFRQVVDPESLKEEQMDHLQPTSLYAALSSCRKLRTWIERSVWAGSESVEGHLLRLNRLAVNHFLTSRLAGSNKRIVGDKTPFGYGEYLGEIRAMFPEAKVVHVIRDGRDVAVSMMHQMWNHATDKNGFYYLEPEEIRRRNAYHAGGREALAEGLFTEDRLRALARDWVARVAPAVENGPKLLGENYIEAYYESLSERPVEELGRILRFLGARDEEKTARSCVEAGDFTNQTSGRERGEEDPYSFFRKGVVGDWKPVFTERDREVFKEEAGELLIALGYEEDGRW